MGSTTLSGGVQQDHRDTLSIQTLQRMIRWLKDGYFKPGSKLPSQNELGEEFGVSRTVVREALQMMAILNLIEIRPGLGCFVKTVSPAEYILNADVLAIFLEKEAILQVVETRKIVECGIAALAAERARNEDYWRMEDALTQVDRSIQRGESVAAVAAEFHYALVLATRNEVLAKLMRSFIHLMTRAGLLLEARLDSVEEFKRNELSSHRSLYNVIRQRDPEAARQAMLDHICHSESLITEALAPAGIPETLPPQADEDE